MRIDIRFGNDDTVATVLNNIPRADRPTALRVLIRKHAGELAGIAGVERQDGAHTAALLQPSPSVAAPTTTAPTLGAAPTGEHAERASLARSLVRFGARHGAHAVTGLMIAGLLAFALPARLAHAGTLDLNYNVSSIHTEAWARRTLTRPTPARVSRTTLIATGR